MKKTLNRTLLILMIMTLSFAHSSQEESYGLYSVPVTDEALRNSSDYDTHYKFTEEDEEITRIKYDLPLELTGEINKIDISYTGDAEYPWSGYLAKGDCFEVNEEFQCNLIYDKEKLVLDEAKTEEAIRSSFAGDEEEIVRRLDVAKIFRGEPAGTTSFKR